MVSEMLVTAMTCYTEINTISATLADILNVDRIWVKIVILWHHLLYTMITSPDTS